jgi:hypothetical protein
MVVAGAPSAPPPGLALKSHGFFRRLLSKVTILFWSIGIAKSAMFSI